MDVENFIFETYKDTPLRNARIFKGKIKQKFKNVNHDDVYIKIMNYQINKYGNALSTYDKVPNKEEERKITIKENVRRYKKRNG